MEWQLLAYYCGYALALYLCWGLGALFRIPMLANLAFDLALTTGLLAGWDIRLSVTIYGFAMLLWVLALAHSLFRTTFVFVLLLDLSVVFHRLIPDLQSAGIGQEFWNYASTSIIEIWMVSIFGVVLSTVFHSTVVAWWKGRPVDLFIHPRKRFLLPLGFWAAVLVLAPLLREQISDRIFEQRFMIAAQLLAWGWALSELPHYLAYARLKRNAV